MKPFLHAAWLPDLSTVKEFVESVQKMAGVVDVAAYDRDPGGEDMQDFATRVGRINYEPLVQVPAEAFVLTELDSRAAGLDLGEALGNPHSERRCELAEMVTLQSLFQEIAYIPGPLDKPSGFGDAVQFGVLSVRTVEDEWRLNEWYERVRYPEVAVSPQQIRSRRYMAVAGPMKYGVLYEFPSLEARMESFEKPIEAHTLHSWHPTSQLQEYTVHLVGAPYIGSRVA